MHLRVLRGAGLTLVALVGTVGLVLTASMTPLVQLTATALIMGGTWMKGAVERPYMDEMNKTYLHLAPDELFGVRTPEEFWPATGPNDITFDASVALGVLSLHNAIATIPGQKIVLSYSQSGNIATRAKRDLDALRTLGVQVPTADELSFVFLANPNRPNGGILARFPGLYIPILGVTFDGATPDDIYKSIDVAREYDLIADAPKYPLNLLADLNALMGYLYLHPDYRSDAINLEDPSTYQSYTSGNTTYYLVHTESLPLLYPFRDVKILTPVLDLIEPTLRVLIDLAYDRTPENMGVPTPAGLLPHIDLRKLASDLHTAVHLGVRNALADVGIRIDDDARPHAEHDVALEKTTPEKVASAVSAPAVPEPAGAREQVTDTPKPDPDTEDPEVITDVDNTVRAEADIRATVKDEKPSNRRATVERIRQSVRQALAPKASDPVKPEDSGGDPHPRVHRSGQTDSSPPKSLGKRTESGGTHEKPRRQTRAGHSDAA